MRWHCPPDTGFEIRALVVWGRARYLSVTEAPHNTEFYTWMGKKHFCFFQTAETRNRAPNSGVKGSGANHYPKAPARPWQGKMPLLCEAWPVALYSVCADHGRGRCHYYVTLSRWRSVCDGFGRGRCNYYVTSAGALDLWWPWHGKTPFPCDASRGRSIYDDPGTGRRHFHVMPALVASGRARYLSVTEAPHNTEFYSWMGKKHFCFFQTAETRNRTPNSGVKGSGANHYPRAPARPLQGKMPLLCEA